MGILAHIYLFYQSAYCLFSQQKTTDVLDFIMEAGRGDATHIWTWCPAGSNPQAISFQYEEEQFCVTPKATTFVNIKQTLLQNKILLFLLQLTPWGNSWIPALFLKKGSLPSRSCLDVKWNPVYKRQETRPNTHSAATFSWPRAIHPFRRIQGQSLSWSIRGVRVCTLYVCLFL